MASSVVAEVVEAFEINDVANGVYQHNFGHRLYQGNIQSLTSADLDKYNADAWLLSPPCQPYTRQGASLFSFLSHELGFSVEGVMNTNSFQLGLQKHSGDARTFSFLGIFELIPHTSKPPRMLFVERSESGLSRFGAVVCVSGQRWRRPEIRRYRVGDGISVVRRSWVFEISSI